MVTEKEKHCILYNQTVQQAIKKINELPANTSLTLIVVDESLKILGTLTDGDIRRGLIKSKNIHDDVLGFCPETFNFIKDDMDIRQIIEFREKKNTLIPIVDSEMRVLKILDFKKLKSYLPLNVVLMAGGEGKRLRPITDTIPKPLVKIEGKPIIEHNLEYLAQYGMLNYYISVNHMKEQIKEYLKDGKKWNIDIKYLEEQQPYGTLGSLSLMPKSERLRDVLLMNSDILTNTDFEEFYVHFKNRDDDLCVATFPYNVDVPYAILETRDNHEIVDFIEKPNYSYPSNAGIYLMKKELLDLIPQNTYFDATDLIRKCIDNGLRVSHYQIKGFWIDIGSPAELKRAHDFVNFS